MNSRGPTENNEREFSRSDFGSKKAPPRSYGRDTGRDRDSGGFGRERREPRSRLDNDGPELSRGTMGKNVRDVPSRPSFTSRSRETREPIGDESFTRELFGRRQPPPRSGGGRSAPERSSFGERRSSFEQRSRIDDSGPELTRSGFGRRAGERANASSGPGRDGGGMGGFGRRGMSEEAAGGMSRSAFGRRLPGGPSEVEIEEREPEPRPAMAVKVNSATSGNPWGRAKPAAKTASPRNRKPTRAAPSPRFGAPASRAAKSKSDNPFMGTGRGLNPNRIPSSNSSRAFTGSGSGFGAGLVQSLTHGGMGSNYGSPRRTYIGKNSSAGPLGGSRFAKPEPAAAQIVNKSPPRAPKPPAVVEDFPTLPKAKVPQPSQRLNIGPSRQELARLKKQEAQEKQARLLQKEEEKRARRAKNEKLALDLKQSVDPSSGKYQRKLTGLDVLSAGVSKLDLSDKRIFKDLCTVVSISIVEDSFQLMALVNKVKDFKESKMNLDMKMEFLVGTLKALRIKKRSDIEAYNFIEKDLDELLATLGIEGEPAQISAQLDELEISYLMPKVNIQEKITQAFERRASPAELIEVLKLGDGIANEICVLVLDHVFEDFFSGSSVALSPAEFLRSDRVELLGVLSGALSTNNELLNIAAKHWYSDRKKDFVVFVDAMIAQKVISLSDVLKWQDDAPTRQYQRPKQEVLFNMDDWFQENNPALKRLKHGSADEESETEEDSADDSDAVAGNEYLGTDWKHREHNTAPTDQDFTYF